MQRDFNAEATNCWVSRSHCIVTVEDNCIGQFATSLRTPSLVTKGPAEAKEGKIQLKGKVAAYSFTTLVHSGLRLVSSLRNQLVAGEGFAIVVVDQEVQRVFIRHCQ